jgi:hypothetical protein
MERMTAGRAFVFPEETDPDRIQIPLIGTDGMKTPFG